VNTTETIGALIDKLGITGTLDEGDLPTSAIVLMRVVESDGSEYLKACYTPGVSEFERVGMLTVAIDRERSGYGDREDDDE